MKDGAIQRKGTRNLFPRHKLGDERRVRRSLEGVGDTHGESDGDEMPQHERAHLHLPADKCSEERLDQNHDDQDSPPVVAIRRGASPRPEKRNDHERGKTHPRLLLRAARVFLNNELLRLHLHPRTDHRDELGDHELHKDACLWRVL